VFFKYFARKRKAKLYRQWVERADLPSGAVPLEADKSEDFSPRVRSSEGVSPEAPQSLRVHLEPNSGVATHPEVSGDMMAEINLRQRNLRLLYVLLGVSLVVLCAGLVLLIMYSC
jgi:hypothetical protein